MFVLLTLTKYSPYHLLVSQTLSLVMSFQTQNKNMTLTHLFVLILVITKSNRKMKTVSATTVSLLLLRTHVLLSPRIGAEKTLAEKKCAVLIACKRS